jgi:DNA-binding NtrC family response regulator
MSGRDPEWCCSNVLFTTLRPSKHSGNSAQEGCDDSLPFLWPTVSDVERQHILDTLRRCHGNRTRTAKLLGISLRGLRLKLREYGQEGFAVADPEALKRQGRLQL